MEPNYNFVADLYIRRLVMFIIAMSLIVGGLTGNLGSMIGAIVDPTNMIESQPTPTA